MVKIKICGLTTVSAVDVAVESGADYIGFVFAKSRREISITQAQLLARHIPKTVQIVGVFVNPTREDLEKHIYQVPLDMVQIHGECDEKVCNDLPVPVIRAVNNSQIVDNLGQYCLLDSQVPGSGKRFDWEKVHVKNIKKPLFIAGGLTSENVREAITYFSPYAVDVSSSVETDGKKDLKKIKRFIERVKYDV